MAADEIRAILEIVLGTVAVHLGCAREEVPLEVEQVITKALFEARKLGLKAERRRHSTGSLPKVEDASVLGEDDLTPVEIPLTVQRAITERALKAAQKHGEDPE